MSEPRSRPSILYGYTECVQTGDGRLYVTLNYDEIGLRELLMTVGRQGGTISGMAEGLGRLISLQLQHGVPRSEIVRHLKGIRSATASDHATYLSIPDALGQILERAPEVLPTHA